ncbi:MAG TPA: hypothetical protein VNF72_02960, partial [Myxococcota bacterium]|nr:hypothetical protein [Myxococcota bacterium]
MGLWAPPERDEEDGSRRAALRTHGARLLLALVLAIATYLLFPAAPATEPTSYTATSVAPENVIAPYAFRVPKAEPELAAEREAALRTVAPVFTYAPAALDSARVGLDAFLRDADVMLAANAPPDASAAFVQRAAALGVRITEPELTYLRDPAQRDAVAAAVRRIYDRWLARGVASNTALDEVRGQVSVVRDGRTELLPAETVPTFGNVLARARREAPEPASEVA